MPILFRMKPGRGKHRMSLDGHRLTLLPGAEIRCERRDLGGAIDKFEQLEPDPPLAVPKVQLAVQYVGKSLYNVTNPATGKAINDAPMPLKDALLLVDPSSSPNAEPQGAEPEVQKGSAGSPGAILPHLNIVPRGNHWYDVIDEATGAAINEKALRKEEAEQLKETAMADATEAAASKAEPEKTDH